MRPVPPHDSRATLLSTDKATAITLDPIGEGKVRVRTNTWDQEVVVLADQVLEVVALGKSLRLVRAPRPLEYLDYDPLGFADAGYGVRKAK
jgi:hypothetical protein